MPSLQSVLAGIPGLAGYEAAKQNNQAAAAGQLQQYGAVQGIMGKQQEMQQKQRDQQEIQQLKGLVAQGQGDPAKIMRILLQDGSPKALALAAQVKGIIPKPAEGYTLGADQARFGPDNQRVATGPQRTIAPGSKPGIRTIYEGDLSIQQELQPDGTWKEIGRGPRFNTGSTRPSYQFFGTPKGVFAGNQRTGGGDFVKSQGEPIVKSSDSPALQGDIAGSKAKSAEVGKSSGEAVVSLPQVVARADTATNIIDQMIGSEDGTIKPHPGFEGYVGFSFLPGKRFIEGTDEASFDVLLKQSLGGAFLEAFQSLKGGGHITEIEGQQATQALTRMNKAQKEVEFIKAAREFQRAIKAGVQRAKAKAKLVGAGAPSANALTPEEQAELKALRSRFGR